MVRCVALTGLNGGGDEGDRLQLRNAEGLRTRLAWGTSEAREGETPSARDESRHGTARQVYRHYKKNEGMPRISRRQPLRAWAKWREWTSERSKS